MADTFIRLAEIDQQDGLTKILFASYLKTDYVQRSLLIHLDRKGLVKRLFFNSNDFGTVEWINGSGLGECHRWESEDQAQNPSYLSRHYTAVLADGERTLEYARTRIIPDVLGHFEDTKFAAVFQKMVLRKSTKKLLDLSLLEIDSALKR